MVTHITGSEYAIKAKRLLEIARSLRDLGYVSSEFNFTDCLPSIIELKSSFTFLKYRLLVVSRRERGK